MFVDDEHTVQELLKCHAHKIRSSPTERCAYLLHMNTDRSVPLDAYFVKYAPEDALQGLDTKKRSVEWFLRQLHTYNYEAEVLAGAVLPSGDVMALVFPSTRYSGARRN